MKPSNGVGKVSLLLKFSCFLLAILLGGSILACQAQKEPLRIGFVETLTGRYSDLGVSGRDGVILAVEEKNRAGGLLGKPIELLTGDDQQDPHTAMEVDRQLIASGVIALIGHMTSEMSLAALPVVNSAQTVMLSPTTASALLSGKKDFFFRVYEPLDREILELAKWILKQKRIVTMALLYDPANETYAKDYAQRFQRTYGELGGKVLTTVASSVTNTAQLMQGAQKIKELAPEAVLIIHNALDTLLVLESLQRTGWKGTPFASAWSMTNEILEQGRAIAEGLHSIVPFFRDHPSEAFQKFRKAFLARFKREPDFPALYGYEAAWVLFRAYEKARAPGEALAKAIVEIKEFEGLQSRIAMDEFGDATMEKYPVVIKEGKMKRAL
ncbi:MAG: ABC transporter substrate-binding protein [bacterium]